MSKIGSPRPVAVCRACSEVLTNVFVDLGLSPIANNLPLAGTAGPDAVYPLKAWYCSRCLLVQVEEVQAPSEIFSDYLYLSSYSSTWLEHVASYASLAIQRLGLSRNSFVVELASNDGHLLRNFQQAGFRVLGVEPAANVAELAMEAGVPTTAEFFGVRVAEQIRSADGHADLVVANNVLAHVPDLHDFIEGIRLLLAPAGTVTVEFPHLLHLIELGQFDTIYHEHFSYFSFRSAEYVFSCHGLMVYHVEELPTHGGSLRLWLSHTGGDAVPTDAVGRLRRTEREFGLDAEGAYSAFAGRVENLRDRLCDTTASLKADGKRLVAYGAPAKASTLLNYCGIGPETLDFTMDANPYKQGRLIPGVRVPIRSPAAFEESDADVVFVLAWNLRREILSALAGRVPGTRFLFHQPAIELV
jgi:SAM-dependent methyltransferase